MVIAAGILFEAGLLVLAEELGEVDLPLEVVNTMGGWVTYDNDELGLIGEGGAGVAALYSCSAWLIIVSGWTLLIGVLIIIEVTRGG